MTEIQIAKEIAESAKKIEKYGSEIKHVEKMIDYGIGNKRDITAELSKLKTLTGNLELTQKRYNDLIRY